MLTGQSSEQEGKYRDGSSTSQQGGHLPLHQHLSSHLSQHLCTPPPPPYPTPLTPIPISPLLPLTPTLPLLLKLLATFHHYPSIPLHAMPLPLPSFPLSSSIRFLVIPLSLYISARGASDTSPSSPGVQSPHPSKSLWPCTCRPNKNSEAVTISDPAPGSMEALVLTCGGEG